MASKMMEKLAQSEPKTVVFPVRAVKPYLTIMRKSRAAISTALDNIAQEVRQFFHEQAEDDWEVTWRAFSTGIRSFYRKGTEKGSEEYKEADRLARGVLNPVRMRLEDIAPAAQRTEATKTRVSVNVKSDPPRTLLNVATSILLSLSERELEDLRLTDLQAALEALEKVQQAITTGKPATAKRAA